MSTATISVPKPKSNKQAKLTELANARVPKALKAIQLIGNLASYEPTTKQVDTIISALRSACKKVEDRLRGATEEDSSGFSL